MSEDRDKKYLYGLGRSDYDAFSALYNSYAGVSYDFVKSLVKDAAAAKDIVQEIFVKIWLKRDTVSKVISFKSYLFRMLKNAVSDYFYSIEVSRRYIASQLLLQDEFVEFVDNKVTADELQLLIFDVINRMPQKRREVMLMSRYENIPNSEIASLLRVSIRTVENHISTALGEIRAAISVSIA